MSKIDENATDPATQGELTEADRQQNWRWTDWIQTGQATWRRVSKKFWRVPGEVKSERYAICRACEHFVPMTTQCRKCYCAMGIKAWYAELSCPEGKWHAVTPPDDDDEVRS